MYRIDSETHPGLFLVVKEGETIAYGVYTSQADAEKQISSLKEAEQRREKYK